MLLPVVHDPELAPALTGDVPGDQNKARAVLQKITDGASVPCRVDVRAADNFANEIVNAFSVAADVFIGSPGKSAMKRLRLGSMATSVMRQRQVPLLCFAHVASAN